MVGWRDGTIIYKDSTLVQVPNNVSRPNCYMANSFSTGFRLLEALAGRCLEGPMYSQWGGGMLLY